LLIRQAVAMFRCRTLSCALPSPIPDIHDVQGKPLSNRCTP
jgi:hypothetical protein